MAPQGNEAASPPEQHRPHARRPHHHAPDTAPCAQTAWQMTHPMSRARHTCTQIAHTSQRPHRNGWMEAQARRHAVHGAATRAVLCIVRQAFLRVVFGAGSGALERGKEPANGHTREPRAEARATGSGPSTGSTRVAGQGSTQARRCREGWWPGQSRAEGGTKRVWGSGRTEEAENGPGASGELQATCTPTTSEQTAGP